MAKLFVIAGHGAGDSGACGNGYKEYERVRALAQKIKDYGGSDVMLGDFNRNYYADNGISKLTISKDYKIIELHMDSSVSVSAKGGHVIIKAGLSADDYDKALAKLITDMFPGRSESIVERDNLANPKRAADKGYNYRLIECCFISNANDVKTFNSKMDELAKGILECFGIKTSGSTGVTTSKPTTSKPTTSTTSSYKGSSLVDYLKSVGKASDFASRKRYATQYGISNYTGTAAQNTKLLELMRGGSKPSSSSTKYYSKYTGKAVAIDTVFAAIGVPATYRGNWKNRAPIAKANGIGNYEGTASQNNKLVTLAKQGKLKKA